MEILLCSFSNKMNDHLVNSLTFYICMYESAQVKRFYNVFDETRSVDIQLTVKSIKKSSNRSKVSFGKKISAIGIFSNTYYKYRFIIYVFSLLFTIQIVCCMFPDAYCMASSRPQDILHVNMLFSFVIDSLNVKSAFCQKYVFYMHWLHKMCIDC